MNFRLESWNALAPGLETQQDWAQWLQHPEPIDEPLGKPDLSSVPAMLRRRFNTLGKCAMGAALPLVQGLEAIPSIFASRHGDTELTFALLREIGLDQPMSPTGFSLAVHNAVSGLFSIARKDISEVTAVAAMQGLVLQTLFEALGQLQERERVLCVIYDIPLPDFYRMHSRAVEVPFPYAIAMILGRHSGDALALEPDAGPLTQGGGPDTDGMEFLRLLTGIASEIRLAQNGAVWRVARENG